MDREMSSPELSPRRELDRSRSRSFPVEEDVNGRSRSPADLSPRRSPMADDHSPARVREDSRSPERVVRDADPSPTRRSPSLEVCAAFQLAASALLRVQTVPVRAFLRLVLRGRPAAERP